MYQLFLYVTAVSVFIVGFLFHFVGQLISVSNWEYARKIGLQERGPKEYKVYEHGIALADVTIGWVHGVAAVGLFLGAPWSFKLIWVPGVILVYHSFCYLFWTNNQTKDGNRVISDSSKFIWFFVNLAPGLCAIVVAWSA